VEEVEVMEVKMPPPHICYHCCKEYANILIHIYIEVEVVEEVVEKEGHHDHLVETVEVVIQGEDSLEVVILEEEVHNQHQMNMYFLYIF